MTKLAVVVLAFVFPVLALAQSEGDYASLKLGAVVPQHRDLKGFDTGLDVDAALGYRIASNLALEAGAAYGKMSGSPSGVNLDLSAISVSASLKAIAPIGRFGLFATVGPGLYFVSARRTDSQSGKVSDRGNALGFHFGGGMSVRLSPQVSVGAEARYLVSSVKVFDKNTGLNSLISQATIEYLF